MSFIRTKSITKDEKGNLITMVEELVGDDGKVKKTKTLQMPLKEFNPIAFSALRKKNFGQPKRGE